MGSNHGTPPSCSRFQHAYVPSTPQLYTASTTLRTLFHPATKSRARACVVIAASATSETIGHMRTGEWGILGALERARPAPN